MEEKNGKGIVRPHVPLKREVYKKVQKKAIDNDQKVSDYLVDLIEKAVNDEEQTT